LPERDVATSTQAQQDPAPDALADPSAPVLAPFNNFSTSDDEWYAAMQDIVRILDEQELDVLNRMEQIVNVRIFYIFQ
jgi:hypothetical protein